MSNFSSRQWIAIAGGLVFFSLLFFINRKAPPSDNAVQQSGHAGNTDTVNFDQVITQSEDSLPISQKQQIDRINNALASSPDSVHPHLYAQLVKLLDSVGQPILSAYYTEKLADVEKSAPLWTHAGQQFYDYAALSKETMKNVLVKQAEQCFNHAIKLDSADADARVGLGECLVDGTNPMQGIATIEGVLQKDSNNRNAQIALGKFSIRSAQFEKAIYRFNRVLVIDPSYKEAYLYLAQAEEGVGNKHEAIANLKKYRIFAPDSSMKAEIDNYIKEKLENDTTK
jgi:tetratricopeptide (TPR) repeat protein